MRRRRRRFGKYRAQVVDPHDPQGAGRIQVESPTLFGGGNALWAVACLPPGYAALPERGDTVWIEFEEGDIDRPLWTGCAWPGSNAPISIEPSGRVRVQARAEIELTGPRVQVVAPTLAAEGVISGTTLIASVGVVSPSYTPGAGNVW
jgi:hypothetical protein